jgi:hypothetical protein
MALLIDEHKLDAMVPLGSRSPLRLGADGTGYPPPGDPTIPGQILEPSRSEAAGGTGSLIQIRISTAV